MKKSWKRLCMGLSVCLLGMQVPVFAEEVTEYATEEAMGENMAEIMSMKLAEANNKFGNTVMAELIQNGENVFISPYSITTALSMFSHCSETGEQIDELKELLGYEAFQEDEILEGQQELMKRLRPDYGLEEFSEMQKQLFGVGTVEIANAFYLDDEIALLPAFEKMEQILEAYQAELAVKPLETKETMEEINAWVREKTHEMIDSILNEPMKDDMALMLMNTVYFKNQWEKPFAEDGTTKMPFYGLDKETEISMMRQQDRFAYAETDEYQIIRLGYTGNSYEMCIWLPKDMDICKKWSDAEYLTKLSNTEVDEEYREVLLSMPKFELEYSTELKDVLYDLGVTKIFDGWTYDRISEEPLAVGSILHKTALKNDEKGTEAAAVTAIMVAAMSLAEQEEPVEMTIDRPFYFTITHTELGLNLFEGCVLNLEEE